MGVGLSELKGQASSRSPKAGQRIQFHDDDMQFANEKGSNLPELHKNQSVVVPTAAMQFNEKDSHHISGLTGVRLGSDLVSSSGFDSDGSSMIVADSNQTLHSDYGRIKPPNINGTSRAKLTANDKSFARTITEELDSEMENIKPNLMPVSELEEEQYD